MRTDFSKGIDEVSEPDGLDGRGFHVLIVGCKQDHCIKMIFECPDCDFLQAFELQVVGQFPRANAEERSVQVFGIEFFVQCQLVIQMRLDAFTLLWP